MASGDESVWALGACHFGCIFDVSVQRFGVWVHRFHRFSAQGIGVYHCTGRSNEPADVKQSRFCDRPESCLVSCYHKLGHRKLLENSSGVLTGGFIFHNVSARSPESSGPAPLSPEALKRQPRNTWITVPRL